MFLIIVLPSYYRNINFKKLPLFQLTGGFASMAQLASTGLNPDLRINSFAFAIIAGLFSSAVSR